MATNKVLLVVGIVEGRKFPRRADHKILVEARFDGEILSTDPIDHNENPSFATELAWESDKKSLHQHRLQRTPLKLQCFAIDINSKAKESIGYCMLDIRSARLNDPFQKPNWFTLLSSKYHGLKPELRVVLNLEDESLKVNLSTQEEKPGSIVAEEASALKPILDEKEGHFLIGDKAKATHIFCLSVTISAAKNLTKVIPSNVNIRLQEGFYFFYQILGNNVSSEPFHDVFNPNFAAERASVRILSSTSILKLFFQKNPSLRFHFCSGEALLATTTVSLLPIIEDNLANDMPSKIEGLFPLVAGSTSHDSEPSGQQQAQLGISVVFKIESDYNSTGRPTGRSPASVGRDETYHPEHPLSPAPKARDSANGIPKDADLPASDMKPGSEEKQRKRTNRPLKFDDDISEDSLAHVDASTNTKKETRFTTKAKSSAKSRHYCYSVDLRSVKNLDIEHNIRCYCRYSYPFFGSSSPVLTSPAVEVGRNTEVLLPKSFCAFDFATTEEMVMQTLTRIPLFVEVWCKEFNRKDALLGVAEINLSSVFTAEKVISQETGSRQIHSQILHILSPDSFQRRVGMLHVVLGLEDFGEIKDQHLATAVGTTQSLISASITDNTISDTSETYIQSRNGPLPPSSKGQQRKASPRQEPQPRELPEYKAAIELELWKEQQEEIFKTLLQEKEKALMQTLADEWRKRGKERELIFQRKIDEYNKLEEKMQTTIADLEQRERKVAESEAEVQRLKADLLWEHEQKLSILREASTRMKEDFDHRIELERMKLEDMREQCKRYKDQLHAAEKRFNDKENEIVLVKEQLLDRPENKLQAELNLALLEKTGLERKLEQISRSRNQYKQQWAKALRELAKVKQNEQLAAKVRLKQQERELEHMRLRYLAAEEKEIMKADKDILASMKEELQRLKESQKVEQLNISQSQATQNHDAPKQPVEAQKTITTEPEKDTFVEHRIAKLIEERDTLLRTGVYSTGDKIISELDRQIREAIAGKGS